MSTTAVLQACLSRLSGLTLTPPLPIAWPDTKFDPPESGMWLEAKLFPNEPENLVWGEGCSKARGFFQVTIGYRPGNGEIGASEVADQVMAHFAKGTALGPVRVVKAPWRSTSIAMGDKCLIPVTIRYTGLVS